MSDILWPWAYGGSSIDRENTLRGQRTPALPPTAKWWGNQARVSKGEPVRIIDFLELDRLQFWARCQHYQVLQGRTPSGLYFDPQVIDDFADTFGKGYTWPNNAPSGISYGRFQPFWSQSFVRVLHDYDEDATEIEVKWDLPWSENMPWEDNWFTSTNRPLYQQYRPFVFTVHDDYWSVVDGIPWQPVSSSPHFVCGLTQRGEVIRVVHWTAHPAANISVTNSTGVVPTHTATLKIVREAALGAKAGDIPQDSVINFMGFSRPWYGQHYSSPFPLLGPSSYNLAWKATWFYGSTSRPFVFLTGKPDDWWYTPEDFDFYPNLQTWGGGEGDIFEMPFCGVGGRPITMCAPQPWQQMDSTDTEAIDAGLYLCGREMIPVQGYSGPGPQFLTPPPSDEQYLNDYVVKMGSGIPVLPDMTTGDYYLGTDKWPISIYAPPRKMNFADLVRVFAYGFPYAEKLNTLRAFCELLSEACKITEGPEHHAWIANPNEPGGGHYNPPIRDQSQNPKQWTCGSVPLPSFGSIYQPEAVGGRRY